MLRDILDHSYSDCFYEPSWDAFSGDSLLLTISTRLAPVWTNFATGPLIGRSWCFNQAYTGLQPGSLSPHCRLCWLNINPLVAGILRTTCPVRITPVIRQRFLAQASSSLRRSHQKPSFVRRCRHSPKKRRIRHKLLSQNPSQN